MSLSDSAASQTYTIVPAGVATKKGALGHGREAASANDGRIHPGYWISMAISSNAFNFGWQVQLADEVCSYAVRLLCGHECYFVRLSIIHIPVFDRAIENFSQIYFVGYNSFSQAANYVANLPTSGVLCKRVQVQFNGLNNEGSGYLKNREAELRAEEVGVAFRGPAHPTSLVTQGWIHAFGTNGAGANPNALVPSGLPASTVGYFKRSQSTGAVLPPATYCSICLEGDYRPPLGPGVDRSGGGAPVRPPRRHTRASGRRADGREGGAERTPPGVVTQLDRGRRDFETYLRGRDPIRVTVPRASAPFASPNQLFRRRGSSSLVATSATVLLAASAPARTVSIGCAGTASLSSVHHGNFNTDRGIDVRIARSYEISITHTASDMNALRLMESAETLIHCVRHRAGEAIHRVWGDNINAELRERHTPVDSSATGA